jgi:hypothetical protein
MGMANANSPFGLRPISNNGTMWTGQGRLYCFPAADASNIFLGDPILALGTSDANGVPNATIASAGSSNYINGVFIGLTNGPAGGVGNAAFTVTRDLPVYVQSGVLAYGLVCDDPNALFVTQEDSVGGAIAAASSAFEDANMVQGNGSAVTGFSGWMLDSSTVANSANLQVKILGLSRGPDNVIGNYAKWVVRLNLAGLWKSTGI